jgi:peptidoglycan LD-endopeptidase CwlK
MVRSFLIISSIMIVFDLFIIPASGVFGQEYVVIDSNISFEEAAEGINFPPPIKEALVLTDVLYYSFDGKLHKGQLLIHKSLEQDIQDVFKLTVEIKFPIGSVIPISKFNWNDSLSMSANNTSAFNYRHVKGTRSLSSHSTGRAIDINPLLNPQIKNDKLYPPGAVYDQSKEGTLFRSSPVVELFIKKGWRWGGSWRSTKDYQHFEKQ